MKGKQDSYDQLQKLFEKEGLRSTSQRRAVFDYLNHTTTHPTARQIYQHLKPDHPSLSLATVYNTLDLLVGAGLVTDLGEVGDNQVHFDSNLHSHINLACTICHQIEDVPLLIPDQLESAIHKSGFKIHGSRIVYYGVCPECQQKSNQNNQGENNGTE